MAAQVFSCKFCEFFQNSFLEQRSGRVLLFDSVLFQTSVWPRTSIMNHRNLSRLYFLEFYEIYQNCNFSENLWVTTTQRRSQGSCKRQRWRTLQNTVSQMFTGVLASLLPLKGFCIPLTYSITKRTNKQVRQSFFDGSFG